MLDFTVIIFSKESILWTVLSDDSIICRSSKKTELRLSCVRLNQDHGRDMWKYCRNENDWYLIFLCVGVFLIKYLLF